jgi:hypothetical protein
MRQDTQKRRLGETVACRIQIDVVFLCALASLLRDALSLRQVKHMHMGYRPWRGYISPVPLHNAPGGVVARKWGLGFRTCLGQWGTHASWRIYSDTTWKCKLRGPFGDVLKVQFGPDSAQTVSRLLPTVAARVLSQVRSFGICGGQSCTGAGFPPSYFAFLCQFSLDQMLCAGLICQPYAPAALGSPETLFFCFWYSFLLEAE